MSRTFTHTGAGAASLGSFRVFSRLILKKYLADTIITFVLTSPPSSYQNNTVSVSAQLVTWVCRCPAPTGDKATFRFNVILFILLKEEDWFLHLARVSLLVEIFKEGTRDLGFQRAWNLGLPQTLWPWLSLPQTYVLHIVFFSVPPGLMVAAVIGEHTAWELFGMIWDKRCL